MSLRLYGIARVGPPGRLFGAVLGHLVRSASSFCSPWLHFWSTLLLLAPFSEPFSTKSGLNFLIRGSIFRSLFVACLFLFVSLLVCFCFCFCFIRSRAIWLAGQLFPCFLLSFLILISFLSLLLFSFLSLSLPFCPSFFPCFLPFLLPSCFSLLGCSSLLSYVVFYCVLFVVASFFYFCWDRSASPTDAANLARRTARSD